MTREMDAAVVAALENRVLYQVWFIDLMFDGDPAYLWTGAGTVPWNGNDYLGAGELGSISALQETVDGRATGVSFTLSSVPNDLLTMAMSGDYQGRPFNVYVAIYDGAFSIIGEPQLITSGEMDQMQVIDGKQGTITLTGETYAANDQNTNETRWTPEAQALIAPGDLFFEFVDDMLDVNLLWGTPAVLPGGPLQTNNSRSFAR